MKNPDNAFTADSENVTVMDAEESKIYWKKLLDKQQEIVTAKAQELLDLQEKMGWVLKDRKLFQLFTEQYVEPILNYMQRSANIETFEDAVNHEKKLIELYEKAINYATGILDAIESAGKKQ